MSNATSDCTLARRAGGLVLRGIHGVVLAAGVVAIGQYFVHSIDHEQVSFGDTGVFSAHAAVVEVKPDGGRWSVAPFAMLGPNEDVTLSGEIALSREMQRVRDWVSRRYRVSSVALEPVLAVAEESARDAGLDPLLIVAMMAIESSFNPMAESRMGAQGLMQVIPRWHMDKIGENAPEDALFDPLFNVQVGTQVLVEGLQRYGTLQAALQYYGGARNDPEARYSKRVLAMKQRLAQEARAGEDA